MAVYIAAHKLCPVHQAPGYIPLQVGAACAPALPYIGDNTGDHISEKNPFYCELTGLYWVYRNTQDAYKGLVHYRRYFARHRRPLSEAEILKLLDGADVVLPRREYLRETAYAEFCLHSGREQDLLLLRQAVAAVDPAVLPAYDAVMRGNRLHLFNMLIARQEIFDRYCAWLFAVLGELEKHVDMSGYSAYEQRLYGFLGERLLNVWIVHAGLRVRTVPVINTQRRFRDSLRLCLRRQKNRLLFAVHHR